MMYNINGFWIKKEMLFNKLECVKPLFLTLQEMPRSTPSRTLVTRYQFIESTCDNKR